jgi:hypothetical protein
MEVVRPPQGQNRKQKYLRVLPWVHQNQDFLEFFKVFCHVENRIHQILINVF